MGALDGAGADVPLGALWMLGRGTSVCSEQGQEAAGAWRGFSHPLAGIFYPGSQAEISLQTGTKAVPIPVPTADWGQAGWAQL